MAKRQRDHEDYWGRCWAVALGRHLNAHVQSSLPAQDPPDVDFTVQMSKGTATTTWGEVTGAYYDSDEAKWLWGGAHGTNPMGVYSEPDALVAFQASMLLERKRQKYSALVQQRGKGQLMILLHSPLTTRSTRVAAEASMLDSLAIPVSGHVEPFESVWLGYRLPITLPSETEDANHVYRDPTGAERLNFMKCIWAPSSP